MGIFGACLEFYRRNSSNKPTWAGEWQDWEQGCAFKWLRLNILSSGFLLCFFLHKAFFMCSCYFVVTLIYLGCQPKKKKFLAPCTLFSWRSFNYSTQESEPATCHRSQVTKGSLQSLSIARPCTLWPDKSFPVHLGPPELPAMLLT